MALKLFPTTSLLLPRVPPRSFFTVRGAYTFHVADVRLPLRRTVTARVKAEEEKVVDEGGMTDWGKVSAVLFDMDGVLCNSEDPSRRAAVDVFKEMGVDVCVDDVIPALRTASRRGDFE